MRIIKQKTSTFGHVRVLRQVNCTGVGGHCHRVAATKDSEILAAPSLTSDSPTLSACSYHYAQKTKMRYHVGGTFTGLTIMLAHAGIAFMHVAAGDIHVGAADTCTGTSSPSHRF